MSMLTDKLCLDAAKVASSPALKLLIMAKTLLALMGAIRVVFLFRKKVNNYIVCETKDNLRAVDGCPIQMGRFSIVHTFISPSIQLSFLLLFISLTLFGNSIAYCPKIPLLQHFHSQWRSMLLRAKCTFLMLYSIDSRSCRCFPELQHVCFCSWASCLNSIPKRLWESHSSIFRHHSNHPFGSYL